MTILTDQIASFLANLERRRFRPNTLTAYRSNLTMAAHYKATRQGEALTLNNMTKRD